MDPLMSSAPESANLLHYVIDVTVRQLNALYPLLRSLDFRNEEDRVHYDLFTRQIITLSSKLTNLTSDLAACVNIMAQMDPGRAMPGRSSSSESEVTVTNGGRDEGQYLEAANKRINFLERMIIGYERVIAAYQNEYKYRHGCLGYMPLYANGLAGGIMDPLVPDSTSEETLAADHSFDNATDESFRSYLRNRPNYHIYPGIAPSDAIANAMFPSRTARSRIALERQLNAEEAPWRPRAETPSFTPRTTYTRQQDKETAETSKMPTDPQDDSNIDALVARESDGKTGEMFKPSASPKEEQDTDALAAGQPIVPSIKKNDAFIAVNQEETLSKLTTGAQETLSFRMTETPTMTSTLKNGETFDRASKPLPPHLNYLKQIQAEAPSESSIQDPSSLEVPAEGNKGIIEQGFELSTKSTSPEKISAPLVSTSPDAKNVQSDSLPLSSDSVASPLQADEGAANVSLLPLHTDAGADITNHIAKVTKVTKVSDDLYELNDKAIAVQTEIPSTGANYFTNPTGNDLASFEHKWMAAAKDFSFDENKYRATSKEDSHENDDNRSRGGDTAADPATAWGSDDSPVKVQDRTFRFPGPRGGQTAEWFPPDTSPRASGRNALGNKNNIPKFSSYSTKPAFQAGAGNLFSDASHIHTDEEDAMIARYLGRESSSKNESTKLCDKPIPRFKMTTTIIPPLNPNGESSISDHVLRVDNKLPFNETAFKCWRNTWWQTIPVGTALKFVLCDEFTVTKWMKRLAGNHPSTTFDGANENGIRVDMTVSDEESFSEEMRVKERTELYCGRE